MASSSQAAVAAAATGPLGALSHDELGVIFDGLADPLQPVVAVALSSTCKGLRTPLRVSLEMLKEWHGRVKSLCLKLHMPRVGSGGLDPPVPLECPSVAVAQRMASHREMNTDSMGTLSMLLRGHWVPKLEYLEVPFNGTSCGDAGVQALCEGLGHGAAPSLRVLNIAGNQIGPAGAEALAAALSRGAMPKLESLNLFANPIGKRGVAALAAPLRQRAALKGLILRECSLGDEGVDALFDGVVKDDFKALNTLELDFNMLTERSCATLVSAIEGGLLPELLVVYATHDATQQAAVDGAVQRFRYEPRVEAILRAEGLDKLSLNIIYGRLEQAAGMPKDEIRKRRKSIKPIIRRAVDNVLIRTLGPQGGLPPWA